MLGFAPLFLSSVLSPLAFATSFRFVRLFLFSIFSKFPLNCPWISPPPLSLSLSLSYIYTLYPRSFTIFFLPRLSRDEDSREVAQTLTKRGIGLRKPRVTERVAVGNSSHVDLTRAGDSPEDAQARGVKRNENCTLHNCIVDTRFVFNASIARD